MIPNVVKGGDMSGLLRYLVGAGRANEHRDPQVISGDSHLVAWYGVENLDKGQAEDIAAYLDRPRKVYGDRAAGKCVDSGPGYRCPGSGPRRPRRPAGPRPARVALFAVTAARRSPLS